jgi:hypothetical protein
MASSFIKQYTSLPLDKPDPGQHGSIISWVPLLSIRVTGKHMTRPSFSIPAYVDSGSPYCLFHSGVADYLRIKPESGIKSDLGGVIGGVREPLYFHKVNVMIENRWMIEVVGGFSRKMSVQAILGRSYFFDRFQVRFDHSTSPPQFEVTKIDLVH